MAKNVGSVEMVLSYKTDLKQIREELKNIHKASTDASAKARKSFEKSSTGIKKELKDIQKAGMKASQGVRKSFEKSSKDIRKGFNSVKKSVSSLGRGLIAIFSIRAIFRFIKSLTNLSSALTEVQNVVDVTFGASSYIIENFAKTSIRNFGLSELAAKKYTSSLGAMLKASGLSTSEAANMSVELTKLAADLASFHDTSFEESFEKIRSALAGQSRPLREFGHDISVANLNLFAMSKGITTTFTKLDSATKSLLRFQYIMANTKDAQGDFNRTNKTWANQLKIASELLKSIGTKIGDVFVSSLRPVLVMFNKLLFKVNEFAESLKGISFSIFGFDPKKEKETKEALEEQSKAYEDVGEAASEASKGVAGFDEVVTLPGADAGGTSGGASGGSSSENAEEIDETTKKLSTMQDVLANMGIDIDVDKVKTNVKNALNNVKDTLLDVGNFTVELALEFISDIDVGGILEEATAAFESFTGTVGKAVDAVLPSLTKLYDTGIKPIVEWIGTKLKDALTLVQVELDKWGAWFEDNRDSIEELGVNIGTLVNDIWLLTEPLLDTIWDTFKTTIETLGVAFRDFGNWVLDNQEALVTGIKAIGGAWAAWSLLKLVGAAAGFLAITIETVANTVATIANTTAQDLLTTSLAGKFIANLKDIGQSIILLGLYAKDLIVKGLLVAKNGLLAVSQGIATAATTAWSVATTVATAAGTAFGAVLTFLATPLGLIVAGVAAVIAIGVLLYKNWDTVKEKGKVALNFLSEKFDGFKNIVSGVVDSIKEKVGGIKDTFKSVFESIPTIMKAPLNLMIDLFNNSIGKLDIKIPDWVPKIGGESFGVPSIPRLKGGGIVNSATKFMAGEAGAEAVIPLQNSSFIKDFAAQVASVKSSNGGGNTLQVDTFIGTEEFAQTVFRLFEEFTNEENDRTGGFAFG